MTGWKLRLTGFHFWFEVTLLNWPRNGNDGMEHRSVWLLVAVFSSALK